MPASVVPIIYRRTDKAILRWYVLDHDGQLIDPAFLPQADDEDFLYVRHAAYRKLVGADPSRPLLHKLQEHVEAHTS
jgi:hypothetical protein